MRKFKRYLIFGFNDHYPKGGLDDVRGSYDTLDEVKLCVEAIEPEFENIEILDCQARKEILKAKISRDEENNCYN